MAVEVGRAKKSMLTFQARPVTPNSHSSSRPSSGSTASLNAAEARARPHVVAEIREGEAAADGKQGQRQGDLGHQLEGVVDGYGKGADHPGIEDAGDAGDDQRIGQQVLEGGGQPVALVAGALAVPDQHRDAEDIDHRNNQANENTVQLHPGLTEGIDDHRHTDVGVEAIAALVEGTGLERGHRQEADKHQAESRRRPRPPAPKPAGSASRRQTGAGLNRSSRRASGEKRQNKPAGPRCGEMPRR